ncbi:MAG: AMP-binding protein [Desulfurococcales archaeon]|nr:AMP-binding protein [Desulfurococcales archaeon]
MHQIPKDRPWFKFYPPGFTLELDYPETTVYELLETSARRFPGKTAVIFYGGRLTYSQVKDYSERLATFLARNGIGKGDRVAIYALNSPHWIIAYFGILRANAVVVPVNPLLRGSELEYIVKDSGAKMIVTTGELLSNAKMVSEDLGLKIIAGNHVDYLPENPELTVPDFMKVEYDLSGSTPWREALNVNDPPEMNVGSSDMAMIPYTAGSTGTPKGCIHTNYTILSNTLSAAYWERVSPGAIHLSALPFFHVTGLIHSLLSPVYTGSTMVLMTRWDRRTAMDAIEKYRVTHWISIATMIFDVLADPDLPNRNLKSLRVTGGGGMPTPKAVAEKWELITGTKYMEGYGLTETISQTHMNTVEEPKYGSIGIPDFGVDAMVIDPLTRDPVKPGELGEIVLRGPEVLKGYWNKPKETEEAFTEINGVTYFRTGDVGYMDEDGYFYIADRLKRMINRAGMKVWPAEVESKLYEHPAIREVVVVGTPSPRVGEEVKAFIVLKEEYKGKVTAEEIISWAKDKMAPYKYPRIIEFVDSIPRTGAGKINWRLLQEKEKQKALQGGNP